MEEVTQEKAAEKPRGRVSRIFFTLSVIYGILSFLFYIGLDAYKIYRDGWTAANIVVTVFLALQIILYAVFLAVGADKKHKKTYKAGKKSLKIAKKIVNKTLSLATSAAVIVGAGSAAGLLDILTLAVAVLALAIAVTEVIWRIVLFVLARKVKKAVREKLGAQEGESLVAAAKNKAKGYISPKRNSAESEVAATQEVADGAEEKREDVRQKSASARAKLQAKAEEVKEKAKTKAEKLLSQGKSGGKKEGEK